MYIAEGSYKKAKYTQGFTFKVEGTEELYRGYYIEDNKGRFYSGKFPGEDNLRLIQITPDTTKKLTAGTKNTIVALAAGLAGKAISDLEKQKGQTKRYFIQDKVTNKISETDKDTFTQAKQEMSHQNFSQVDWIIKGPADNQTYGNYSFEGAASKNEKAIKALESQMKGISTFVTDYRYLVEEPTVAQSGTTTSEAVTVKDPAIELENSRKANFDTKN